MDSKARQAAYNLSRMLDERTDHGRPQIVFSDDLCGALFGCKFLGTIDPHANHADVRWLIESLERA